MKATVMIRAKTQEDLDYIKKECKGTVWEAQLVDAVGNLTITGVTNSERVGIEPKAKAQVVVTFEG